MGERMMNSSNGFEVADTIIWTEDPTWMQNDREFALIKKINGFQMVSESPCNSPHRVFLPAAGGAAVSTSQSLARQVD